MTLLSTDSLRHYFDLLNPKYISWDFYQKYLEIEPPFGQLGVIVFLRTYSRFIPELKRREKFAETCLRVVEYSLSLDTVSDLQAKVAEAEQLFDCLFNLRGFASGRAYWIAGTKQTEKCGSATWNCCFRIMDDISAFSEVFYWLLLGAGVGFSVENKYISKLPKFYTNKVINHYDYDFNSSRFPHTEVEGNSAPHFNGQNYVALTENLLIVSDEEFLRYLPKETHYLITVGDSKEGWCNALRALMHLMTLPNVQSITFNYNNIRPKGERIKTFGGRASGHVNIQEVLQRTFDIICASDGRLSSVDVLDEVNSIGVGVVSGGVRRTAEIGLGDVDDAEYIDAKLNLWTDPAKAKYRSIRVMSNNSVVPYEKLSLSEIQNLVERIKTNGEPGFWILGNAQKHDPNIKGTNPCFRGDMKLLTVEGYKTFEELNGTEPLIVNAFGEVSQSKVWCSGEKDIVKLTLTTPKPIYCTADHVFLTDNGEFPAEQCKGKRLIPYLKAPNHNVHERILGFIQGDGQLSETNFTKGCLGVVVNLGKKDTDILNLLEQYGYEYTWHGDRRVYVHGFTSDIFKKEFDLVPLPYRKLPNMYRDWDKSDKAAFLNGLYSANGSVIASGRITFKTTSFALVPQLIDTLNTDFGIEAYYTTNKPRAVEFTNGIYQCRESYDVNIQQYAHRCTFFNEIGFSIQYKEETLAKCLLDSAPLVRSIKSAGVAKVYDFAEPLEHWGVVEGIVTHNCGEASLDSRQSCNLVTQNLAAHVINKQLDHQLLERTLKLITRVACRQTTATQWHPDWDLVQKRDRLIGVSMTGVEDAFDVLNWDEQMIEDFYNWAADIVRDEADKYNAHLGIERSKRVTLVKPEGTLSQLPTVSSGIGKAYAPYYLRRVRFSSLDPLAVALEKLGVPVVPENEQGDNLFDEKCNTWVFTFPIKTNAKIRAIDEPVESQFERYVRIQNSYVREGYNASNTITVSPDEWDKVPQLIYNNWDKIIGVTFLPRFDPREGGKAAYPNMPYEPCEQHEYEELFADLPKLSENELIQLVAQYEHVEEEQSLEDSCSTGMCPVR